LTRCFPSHPRGFFSMVLPEFLLLMVEGLGKVTPYHRSFLYLPLTLLRKSWKVQRDMGSFTNFRVGALFSAPIKQDILNLATILQRFGMVTGLCTNFLKSSVIPIRCGQIDLDEVFEGIPATRAFPLQYLVLPLSVWSLSRRGFQHLEDKCAGKLPTWSLFIRSTLFFLSQVFI
jgi:hypothetical protein